MTEKTSKGKPLKPDNIRRAGGIGKKGWGTTPEPGRGPGGETKKRKKTNSWWRDRNSKNLPALRLGQKTREGNRQKDLGWGGARQDKST